jgi:hypothetical protein
MGLNKTPLNSHDPRHCLLELAGYHVTSHHTAEILRLQDIATVSRELSYTMERRPGARRAPIPALLEKLRRRIGAVRRRTLDGTVRVRSERSHDPRTPGLFLGPPLNMRYDDKGPECLGLTCTTPVLASTCAESWRVTGYQNWFPTLGGSPACPLASSILQQLGSNDRHDRHDRHHFILQHVGRSITCWTLVRCRMRQATYGADADADVGLFLRRLSDSNAFV